MWRIDVRATSARSVLHPLGEHETVVVVFVAGGEPFFELSCAMGS
jgi:hypothetical protein